MAKDGVKVDKSDKAYSRGESMDDYLDRTFGKKGSGVGADLGRGGYEMGNNLRSFAVDAATNAGNALAYLLGDSRLKNAGSFVRSAYDKAGVPVFRRTYERSGGQNTGDTDRRRSTRLRGRTQQMRREESAVEEGSGKTLQDYIAEIESMMGGGADFGALRDRLSSKTAESDARLEAMYRSLGQARDAAAPELSRTYDTAKGEIEKAAEQTAASISQGYQDAQNQRAQELAALGIEDAATRPEGERIAEDQGFARQIAAQGSQGSLNANASNKASSLAYNTDMRGVGDMQGVEARASLQSRLRDELAEIAFQESAQRAQRRQSAISQAMQMMQADQAAQGDGLTAWQRAQLERDYAQFQAEQGQYQQGLNADQQGAQRRLWTQLLEMYDGDTMKAKEVFDQTMQTGLY